MGTEPLLVMDEPTTGLDPLMQREFLALVAEARDAGRAVFSSHNLREVERTCHRVAIIREGRLVDLTSIPELLASHWRSVNLVPRRAGPGRHVRPAERPRSRVERADLVHLMVKGEVNELLRRIARLDVRDVSIATPDIEDVFLGFREPAGDDVGEGGLRVAGLGRVGGSQDDRPGLPPPGASPQPCGLLLWIGLVAAAYGAFIAAFYPVIRDNVELWTTWRSSPSRCSRHSGSRAAWPTTPCSSTRTSGACSGRSSRRSRAPILGTRTVAADLDRGFIELPLGDARSPGPAAWWPRSSRSRSCSACWPSRPPAGVLVVGAIVGAGFDTAPFLAASVVFWLFACAIAGVTSFVAAVTLSRGTAAGVAAGLLLVMYLMNIVAELQGDLAWLADFRWLPLPDRDRPDRHGHRAVDVRGGLRGRCRRGLARAPSSSSVGATCSHSLALSSRQRRTSVDGQRIGRSGGQRPCHRGRTAG